MSSNISSSNGSVIDLYKVSHGYLQRILGSNTGSRDIRVLLLDNSTSSIISMFTTQSELLKNEIYLIDKLENHNRDKLRNLKCICFLKPTDTTITSLSSEIGNPNYMGYEIYFNNVVSSPRLERLAESDDFEMISTVAEVFIDYYIVNKDVFTPVGIDNPFGFEAIDTWDSESFKTSSDSLTSLLLSLKLKPVIRYESNSSMCSKLASSINFELNSNSQLFDLSDKKDVPPLLLILDRKNDPITPLLFPWTYQSMIHDIIGVKNNTADLSNLPNVSDELKTVVLNETQDQFYKESMYLNFGELSESLKKFVDTYKAKTKTNSNINTIQDMKFFLENYPEFKKISLNLSKHMLLSTEIDRQISESRMWEVGEFEQSMVSISDNSRHSTHLQELEQLLFDRKKNNQGETLSPIPQESKLRLLSLYALKYETFPGNQTKRLLRDLQQSQKLRYEQLQFVNILLNYAGASKRMATDEGSIFDKVTNASNSINGLMFDKHGDSNNIYMQHIPRLQNILIKLARNKLSPKNFPILKQQQSITMDDKVSPQEIVIFFVGGLTYEEARLVSELNKLNPGLKCVIGGTNMINSKKFVENISDVGSNWGGSTINRI